jgi:hypothetical protein
MMPATMHSATQTDSYRSNKPMPPVSHWAASDVLHCLLHGKSVELFERQMGEQVDAFAQLRKRLHERFALVLIGAVDGSPIRRETTAHYIDISSIMEIYCRDGLAWGEDASR